MKILQVLPEVSVLLPSPEQTQKMAKVADALSDPNRLHILALLSAGRECCNLPDCCIGDEEGEEGICVCELTEMLGMIQSKVSYHIAKLKEANLIRESRRGKWTHYSVDRKQARHLLSCFSALLDQKVETYED